MSCFKCVLNKFKILFLLISHYAIFYFCRLLTSWRSNIDTEMSNSKYPGRLRVKAEFFVFTRMKPCNKILAFLMFYFCNK